MTIPLQFSFLDGGQHLFIVFVMCYGYEMPSTLLRYLISTAWIFLCTSVSVHVLHAYKKIDRTSACSSFSLVDWLMFLSLHIGFSFASAAAVCTALARTSVFEPSSLRIAPRYLNWFTVLSSCPLTAIFFSIGFLLFVVSFVFLALTPCHIWKMFCPGGSPDWQVLVLLPPACQSRQGIKG